MTMKKINLKSIIWKEGGYYVAQCLNFDVSSFGRTKSSAIANLKEAVSLYLEDMPKTKISRIQSPQLVESVFQYA